PAVAACRRLTALTASSSWRRVKLFGLKAGLGISRPSLVRPTNWPARALLLFAAGLGFVVFAIWQISVGLPPRSRHESLSYTFCGTVPPHPLAPPPFHQKIYPPLFHLPHNPPASLAGTPVMTVSVRGEAGASAAGS